MVKIDKSDKQKNDHFAKRWKQKGHLLDRSTKEGHFLQIIILKEEFVELVLVLVLYH